MIRFNPRNNLGSFLHFQKFLLILLVWRWSRVIAKTRIEFKSITIHGHNLPYVMNVLLERVWPIPPCLPTFSPWFFLLGLPRPPLSPPKVFLDHLWAHCRTIAWMVLYHLYAWTCPWPQPGSFNFSEPRKLVSGSMFGGMCNTWPVKISEST